MNQVEFKTKLDNKELRGQNSSQIWDAAYEWEKEANENDSPINWSWDIGLKLDYDGDVCRISSRFYPPHKSTEEYGKYHGTISVFIGGEQKCLHEHEIEAETLDELKTIAEGYVSKVFNKVSDAIKTVFQK